MCKVSVTLHRQTSPFTLPLAIPASLCLFRPCLALGLRLLAVGRQGHDAEQANSSFTSRIYYGRRMSCFSPQISSTELSGGLVPVFGQGFRGAAGSLCSQPPPRPQPAPRCRSVSSSPQQGPFPAPD